MKMKWKKKTLLIGYSSINPRVGKCTGQLLTSWLEWDSGCSWFLGNDEEDKTQHLRYLFTFTLTNEVLCKIHAACLSAALKTNDLNVLIADLFTSTSTALHVTALFVLHRVVFLVSSKPIPPSSPHKLFHWCKVPCGCDSTDAELLVSDDGLS